MGNKAEIEKLEIGTRTDSNKNDPGMINRTTAQTYGANITTKEATATVKERPNLLVEEKAKTYFGLKVMAKKFFFKYGQVESIAMHLQNATLYHAKYKSEENEVKALIDLEKEVAEVTTIEEKT